MCNTKIVTDISISFFILFHSTRMCMRKEKFKRTPT